MQMNTTFPHVLERFKFQENTESKREVLDESMILPFFYTLPIFLWFENTEFTQVFNWF